MMAEEVSFQLSGTLAQPTGSSKHEKDFWFQSTSCAGRYTSLEVVNEDADEASALVADDPA
eukprot:CAMPEP_0176050882 /NCGR_PEP_ID=MMETSP0120_2-20121206/25294_1 /TAXON_ID=160619 /ORGANISM="Kryptoperidinium foliaceum, Strain CCMP 1326" /LENGTH=60 /DNA_ID=CAMNT_0017384321 /DNA_START=87 /DNA_END=265 /DNA_ORIENTATION=+